MDTGRTDILSRHPVTRHRLTVTEYHRLGEAGILGVDDRVELLEGQLVDMSPIGPRHALAVDALTELLVVAAAGRAAVRVQNPIVLDDATEPQPDIVLVRRPWRGFPTSHPGPGDIFLVIEVADTSRETDLGAKLELYARAGIPEFWIVDLTTDGVLVGPKSRRRQIWVDDEGRALGHSGCARSARVVDTGGFTVRVAWQRLPAFHIPVSGMVSHTANTVVSRHRNANRAQRTGLPWTEDD